MSHLKDNLAWARFSTMQHRSRGIPVPNMNAVHAENRRLNDLVNHQLSMMVSMKEDLNTLVRQRDEYASLWMDSKKEKP